MTSPRGISLVETLIGLALSSALLVAVAAAYDVSSAGIESNDRFFRATQAARVAMTRMLQDFRTAETITVGDLAMQQASQASATFVDVLRPDGTMISYLFSPEERTLTLVQRDMEGEPAFVLARHVQFAGFTADVEPHPDTGRRRTVRATVSVVVEVNGQALRLSGSSAPRRSIVY